MKRYLGKISPLADIQWAFFFVKVLIFGPNIASESVTPVLSVCKLLTEVYPRHKVSYHCQVRGLSLNRGVLTLSKLFRLIVHEYLCSESVSWEWCECKGTPCFHCLLSFIKTDPNMTPHTFKVATVNVVCSLFIDACVGTLGISMPSVALRQMCCVIGATAGRHTDYPSGRGASWRSGRWSVATTVAYALCGAYCSALGWPTHLYHPQHRFGEAASSLPRAGGRVLQCVRGTGTSCWTPLQHSFVCVSVSAVIFVAHL